MNALKPLLAVLLPWTLACSSAASAGESLNVVMIMVDDLGIRDLACYGSDLHTTPNIDRFARSNLKFTTAYAAAAICSTSSSFSLDANQQFLAQKHS